MPRPDPADTGIPTDYYWRHFRIVVVAALDQHAHLFDDAERARMEGLLSLPRPARRLFVRLFNRKGDRFRRSRLRYPEIEDLDAAAEQLAAAGLLEVDPDGDGDDEAALALLTVPELRAVARDLGLPAPPRRAAVLAALAEADPAALRPRVRSIDRVWRLRAVEPFEMALVSFFGNRHQDLTEFVLVDLERTAYHPYRVSRDRPLFPDREALETYLDAAARREACLALEEGGDLDGMLDLARAARRDLERRPAVPPHRRRTDPARHDERVVLAAARALERAGEHASAVDLMEPVVRRGRSPSRAARAADRLGLAMGRAGLASGFDDAVAGLLASPRLDDLSRFLLDRRRHLLGLGDDPRTRLRRPPVIDLTFEAAGHDGPRALYAVDGQALTVEQATLLTLGGEGWWCENALVTTLFGLLLWDQVFADVPGMFQHAFQDGPLDLGTSDFYANRREGIEARLAELATADLPAEVERSWEARRPRRCHGVQWDGWNAVQLGRAAVALGPALVPALRRLARHPRLHRRGLPDLFLLRGDAALLVEVKGPGDQPSPEQRLWHDALLRAGADVRIARVKRARGGGA